MIYKIVGPILVFTGIILIVKFEHFLVGLGLLFLGFFLGMKLGMKPE